MPQAVPFHKPGQTVTGIATGAIIGRRMVKVSGKSGGNDAANLARFAGGGGAVKVAQTAAGDRAIGVASVDKASGQSVMFWRDGVLPIDAGGAITAGDELASDALGRVVRAVSGQVVVGYAWDDAASGQVAQVEFIRTGIRKA